MQLYWINTAAKIKEQNFEHTINQTAENVIYKIQKVEATKSINKEIKSYPNDSTFLNSLDSVKKFFYNHYSGANFQLQTSNLKLLKDVIENILNYDHFRLIENKIKVKELDSLLHTELKNKGINISYEFGIYSPSHHMLVLQKTGKFTDELLKNSYKYNLYPNDIYMPAEYLYIYFPHRETYILTHVWGILLLSALLIATLVYIFTFTINTLIRQKRLDELKSDLINNLTHEFKTPISTISIACEALKDKDLQKSPLVYEKYLNIIIDENQRLEAMAENVLQAAIIDKGFLRLYKMPLSVHQTIESVIKSINLQIENKNGIITTDFQATNDVINADATHLSGVIYNLLDNANKYSQYNPKINIRTENRDEGIIISVSDNGIGISKQNQKKIFDTLYRVPTGNVHDVKGHGLGLGYVKAIVEKHGGNISVDSDIKRGAIFKIWLPFL